MIQWTRSRDSSLANSSKRCCCMCDENSKLGSAPEYCTTLVFFPSFSSSTCFFFLYFRALTVSLYLLLGIKKESARRCIHSTLSICRFAHQDRLPRAEGAVKGAEETFNREHQWNGSAESLANARLVSFESAAASFFIFLMSTFCVLHY